MNSKDHKAPNVDGTMFAGTWNHMFGPGRFETQCRIVIDVKAHKLVAAQALNGLNWLNLSVAEKADLSESLFEGNDVSSAPAEFDLEQVGNLPEWAIPAVGKAAAVVVTGSTDVRCYGLAEGESADSNVINDVQSGPATRTIERALCRGKTATGHEESVGPTDRDIVEGAERMARILLQSMGFDFFGESVRASSNPRAVRAWNVVGALLEEYNGTDLSSAVDALEEEGCSRAPDCSPIAAFEAGVSAALQEANGLSVVFSSMLQDRTRQNAVYHAHSGQRAAIVGVGITPAQESGWDEESLPFVKIRFQDGVELPVFGEELFSHDDRFFALCSAVFGGYGAARDVADGFAGPYHLARDGSISDKEAFLAELKVMGPTFTCVQAPWTPSEFRVGDSTPSTKS
ncbi:hypothetical protein ACO2TQ_39110 [Burkholderia sp. OKR4-1]|uniref:hypothetical protein n=1 Tax=Burkholderia TaxID=32008 RepID=UPI0024C1E052|nr:hypothetical protein [Burkholderia contaminans]MDK1000935.1 hypothetical protein [Burkholderia contaminans]